MFVRAEAYSFKPGDRVVSLRDFESCAGKFMAPIVSPWKAVVIVVTI